MIKHVLTLFLVVPMISCMSQTRKMDPAGARVSLADGSGPEKTVLSKIPQGRSVQRLGRNWVVTFNLNKGFDKSLELKLDRNRYSNEFANLEPHPFAAASPKIYLADPDRLQVTFMGDPEVFDQNYEGRMTVRIKLDQKMQEKAAQLGKQVKREVFPILYLESCNEGGYGQSSVEALPSTYDQISNEVFAEIKNGHGFWSSCQGSKKGLRLSLFIGLPAMF